MASLVDSQVYPAGSILRGRQRAVSVVMLERV